MLLYWKFSIFQKLLRDGIIISDSTIQVPYHDWWWGTTYMSSRGSTCTYNVYHVSTSFFCDVGCPGRVLLYATYLVLVVWYLLRLSSERSQVGGPSSVKWVVGSGQRENRYVQSCRCTTRYLVPGSSTWYCVLSIHRLQYVVPGTGTLKRRGNRAKGKAH
jgi:hypothetical protein